MLLGTTKRMIVDFVRRVSGHESILARLDSLELSVRSNMEGFYAERRDLLRGTMRSNQLELCRNLALRAIFIIGPARSGTTVLAEVVNASRNALILTEANFFAQLEEDEGFRERYNRQHLEFNNQVSKSTYAPDFAGDAPWWEWLDAASLHYERIGEKIALSDYHLGLRTPGQIQAFFEARFFQSQYVFVCRDPIQTLLSQAHLFQVEDDLGMMKLCIAWLRTVQLWADFIRVFPRTTTVLSDNLDVGVLSHLAQFLELDLSGADTLFDERERRHHEMTDRFPSLAKYGRSLAAIYQDVRTAVDEGPIVLQADQKRSLALNDTRTTPEAGIALAPHAIGQAWARADDLAAELSRAIKRADGGP